MNRQPPMRYLLGFLVPTVLGLGVPWLLGSPPGPAGEAVALYSPATARATTALSETVLLPLVASNYEPPVPTVFGVQMYGDLTLPSAGLTHTQDAKVYWVRWPISWSAIEPTDTVPANYNFSRYDASILAASQNGLHLIATILSNPGWAASYANGPIDKVDIGEFTEFVGTIVERYDGDGWEDAPGSPVVDYWEFYNEPDGGDELRARYGYSYWGHFGAEYAQMLCAVYPVIKQANPRAQVALGGLAYDWFEDQDGPYVREFLDDVLAAGGGDCFDLMNFHYYPLFEPVWAPYGPGIGGKANYLRIKLAQFGFADKPIINTEAGWHSDDYYVSPSTPEIQARYVAKLFAQSIASGLELMIWWTWIDPGGFYGANGLLTQDLQRKPSFYAYATAAQIMGRASFRRALSLDELGDPAMEGYQLTMPDGRDLYVLWSNDEITRSVNLPLSQVRVTNLYGDLTVYVDDGEDGVEDGQCTLSVGPNPIYAEAVP